MAGFYGQKCIILQEHLLLIYLSNSLAGVQFKNLAFHPEIWPSSGWIAAILLATYLYVEQSGAVGISLILYSSQPTQLRN
jgi:hypothetical protein